MPISENIVHTVHSLTTRSEVKCTRNLGLSVVLFFLQNKLDINKKYAFSKNISYRCVKSKAIVFVSFAVMSRSTFFVRLPYSYKN